MDHPDWWRMHARTAKRLTKLDFFDSTLSTTREFVAKAWGFQDCHELQEIINRPRLPWDARLQHVTAGHSPQWLGIQSPDDLEWWEPQFAKSGRFNRLLVNAGAYQYIQDEVQLHILGHICFGVFYLRALNNELRNTEMDLTSNRDGRILGNDEGFRVDNPIEVYRIFRQIAERGIADGWYWWAHNIMLNHGDEGDMGVAYKEEYEQATKAALKQGCQIAEYEHAVALDDVELDLWRSDDFGTFFVTPRERVALIEIGERGNYPALQRVIIFDALYDTLRSDQYFGATSMRYAEEWSTYERFVGNQEASEMRHWVADDWWFVQAKRLADAGYFFIALIYGLVVLRDGEDSEATIKEGLRYLNRGFKLAGNRFGFGNETVDIGVHTFEWGLPGDCIQQEIQQRITVEVGTFGRCTVLNGQLVLVEDLFHNLLEPKWGAARVKDMLRGIQATKVDTQSDEESETIGRHISSIKAWGATALTSLVYLGVTAGIYWFVRNIWPQEKTFLGEVILPVLVLFAILIFWVLRDRDGKSASK